jgi:hypothetical protein
MNVIFGSGIVGMLAKVILGPGWKVIPFYRSRFFSFNPALDDNFIVKNVTIDPFIKDLMGNVGHPMIYSRAWSIGGHIVKNFNKELLATWSHKVFGYDVPTQVEPYFNSKMTSTIYDIRVNQLYQTLCNRYAEEIKAETALGPVTEIGDHYYIRNNVKEEFDHAVNTIPLPQFNKLAGYESKVKAKTIHYLHIETEDLNFEGHNQLMVVDEHFGFYKVTNIAPKRFLFYCHEDLVNPGVYMMQFMNKFDIIDGTSIQDVVPSGQIPKLEYLENKGIYSVGSAAQWDWCMDVGSCIIRLLKYAQNGYGATKPRIVKI